MVRAAEVHTLGVLLQMEEKHEGRELPISGLLGSLTGREVSIVEREEQIFRNVLSQIPTLGPCIDILLQRHEWYDGTGSILGFKGEGICREARILMIEVLGRAGRSAEAISYYESAIDLFENEIGVAPERLKEPLVELGLLL